MGKRHTHEVYLKDLTKKHLVGTISLHEIARKLRKPQPPTTKVHTSKKAYKRKPKHPNTEIE